MTTRAYLTIAAAVVIFAIGGVVGCQTHAHFNPVEAVPLIGNTVVKRDTVYVPKPYAVASKEVGKVTITPRKDSDTVKTDVYASNGGNVSRETFKDDTPTLQASGNLDIPITSKVYQGEDYRAVVSGWRPSLDSLAVYPKTVTVEKIVTKRPRFSITVGPGYGYDGKEFKPNISITAGFTIFSR